ncbi:MAG TPA: protein translocase subunit SecDF [Bacteroidales bacterium]|nr:protein translocase subunit SecDF [Bacteroidales bacterium]HPS63307.1 protein translocase subunit SecDF [Bacteroidales bacterium]
MQHKGVVKFFAITFILVCLFQLSFTVISYYYSGRSEAYANSALVKSEARKMAQGDRLKEEYFYDSISKSRQEYFNDSMASVNVFNILLKKYTLKDVREREINLGLDLKGGMNVTMAVSVPDVIRALSGNNQDPTFLKALNKAIDKEKSSTRDFVDLFAESFKEIDPNAKLAAIFNTVELKDRINYNSTNDQVIKVIREESNAAIDRTYNILTTRIDRFGVVQPNIQRLQTAGRILIELPGIKDPERVRKLLQGTAQLEFWETYQFPDLQPFFSEANTKLVSILTAGADSARADSTLKADTAATAKAINSKQTLAEKKATTAKAVTPKADTAKKDTSKGNALLKQLDKDTSKAAMEKKKQQSFEEYAQKNPLFAYLNPAIYQNKDGQYVAGQTAMVGRAFIKDTARVNHLLRMTKGLFPRDLKLAWTVKPRSEAKDVLELVALKVTSRDGSPALGGDVIVSARQDYDQNGRVEVSMSMNSEGARIWKRLTGENIGKQVAIVLDGYVYSYPNVNSEIPNGMSSITGGEMTIEEAQDLANILKAGKLPAPARIVAEEIVGPSLGQESINAGLLSFIIAFIGVLLYMSLYYGRAGHVADIALFANVFFLFGVMASIGAVLTLPGIAGIVLTLAMAVDSNVIIYERMREEIRAGKGMRLVVKDGFRHALSAIIDGHVTTILTGVVLYIFGSGPVQGFATTLVLGLLLSLFSSIFIARLVFEWMLDREMHITTGNRFTMNLFQHTNINFIGLRNKMYLLSILIIIPGIVSIFVRGLDPGLDFTGGRSFIVRFDQNVHTNQVRESLRKVFGESPEVKTFGPQNQVKITTKFMISERSKQSDSIVAARLYEGVKSFYGKPISFEDFKSNSPNKIIGELSSQRVDPTISYALIWKAFMAVLFSLIIIFIYIAFRFKNWQFGVGGVVALAHDSLIIITMFTLFHGILPFGMEIDQHFIAALLTIIGYSIMDTVIIFDRIREYRALYPKRDLASNINAAINSTLGRTINTSGVTLVTLITIFIFGGEVLRGFTFALMIGVISGTYSSVFNATPIAYDILMWQKRRREKKELEASKSKAR